ncbi:cupin domain-containing protein [Synechococcus sp. RSCCF101]|uniref:cupin domain-containing protein n=1 Tax=Synechococcus sp. RSCCF101 TaxID=2511069 RepID=UPI0012459F7E|nr:cupin domain-containing protein [Synechococcus sp. RSCCF101]QEY32249.1 cupin domain-containing protein [Synechococcus sp. RSCCF101]
MAEPHRHCIDQLGLRPHPEGGHYRETYRSSRSVPTEFGPRSAGTAILYLLGPGECSRFHRLRWDELWHHHDGGALTLHVLTPEGDAHLIRLGSERSGGVQPQAVVQAGSWFAAEPATPEGWSLMGCTVAPGFDFEDLEFAQRDALLASHPGQADLIARLTPD